MTLFDEAILFAVEKHAGMTRKLTRTPYILHPLEAAAIVGTITDDPEILAAAVLHDVVEDAGVSLDEIERRFGARVAALVGSETEDKRPGLPPEQSWRIRKEESLAALERASDPAVRLLWLGDKLSNMRSFHRAWRRRGHALWSDFNQKDPARQAWYYRRIDALLGEVRDTEAGREFHALVEEVFSEVT